MRNSTLMAVSAALVFLCSSAAEAGPATDALSRCVTQSSTGKDRLILVEWIYAAMSAHPDVHPMSNITPEQQDRLDREMTVVFERLLLKDCRAETVAAMKEGGENAVGTSFEELGKIAMSDLMTDKDVQKGMQRFTQHMDMKQWSALNEEIRN